MANGQSNAVENGPSAQVDKTNNIDDWARWVIGWSPDPTDGGRRVLPTLKELPSHVATLLYLST